MCDRDHWRRGSISSAVHRCIGGDNLYVE